MIEVVQAKTFAEIHNSFYKNLYCNVFRKLLHLKKHYFQMKNSMEIVQMLQCDVSQVASMTDRYAESQKELSYLCGYVAPFRGAYLHGYRRGRSFFTPCGSIVNCRRRHSFHYVLSVCHRQLTSSLEYIADTDHCCPADGKAFRLSVQAHRAARGDW